jgi:hypothetical protein
MIFYQEFQQSWVKLKLFTGMVNLRGILKRLRVLLNRREMR